MNEYVVLVCGLNIRKHNRISKPDQIAALNTMTDKLTMVRVEGDKGSYLITSDQSVSDIAATVLSALVAYRPDLEIPGAAVVLPTVVCSALAALTGILTSKYGQAFNPKDYGVMLDGTLWRAGLALPLFPGEIPMRRSVGDKLTNAIVLGWTNGCVLVVKREAKNVHWGTTVTDPASRRLKRLDGVLVDLTSRSGNVLRELVG